jgi:hypothetical protein
MPVHGEFRPDIFSRYFFTIGKNIGDEKIFNELTRKSKKGNFAAGVKIPFL